MLDFPYNINWLVPSDVRLPHNINGWFLLMLGVPYNINWLVPSDVRLPQ